MTLFERADAPSDGNLVEAIWNLRSHYQETPFLEQLRYGGSLFVILLIIGLLSIPMALTVIIRTRARAWSLLASMAPFPLASLSCPIHALSMWGYMSGPQLNTVLGDVALQIQVFSLGCIATVLLAIISLIIPRRSQIAAQQENAS